jgi:hypothetical protein
MTVLSSHEDLLNEVREQLEKVAAVNRSIQIDLQSMSTNGRFNLETPGEAIENTVQIQNVDEVDATRLSKIDSEISSLAARIENLRKMRARLHDSDDSSLER